MDSERNKPFKREGDQYYSCFKQARDGENFYGKGMTEEQAIEDVNKHVAKHEEFLALPYRSQLVVLLQKEKWSEWEQRKAIDIIGSLVLDLTSGSQAY